MSSILLREAAGKLAGYDIVIRVEFLGSKLRAYITGGYVLDIYYNKTMEKYSYTLIKENKRIIGWDNAPHHINIDTCPHHFHHVDGTIKPSYLSGELLKDVDEVMNFINNFLRSG